MADDLALGLEVDPSTWSADVACIRTAREKVLRATAASCVYVNFEQPSLIVPHSLHYYQPC